MENTQTFLICMLPEAPAPRLFFKNGNLKQIRTTYKSRFRRNIDGQPSVIHAGCQHHPRAEWALQQSAVFSYWCGPGSTAEDTADNLANTGWHYSSLHFYFQVPPHPCNYKSLEFVCLSLLPVLLFVLFI